MGTLKVNGDIHSTGLVLNGDWENNFGIRFREGGSSDSYGAYIMYGLDDAFTFGTRNDNNDLTAFSMPRTGNTVTFYGDIVMTSPKAIYTNSIIPNDTKKYIIGTSEKEYASTYSRQVFTRHIEPATNVNNDVYICYNNRGGAIRAYAPLDMSGIGSIVNLPIGGGLYWNPYVESSTDGSDAASITLHANGVGGGTELRITMANDGNDVINLNPASWVYLQGKAAFRVDDSWLRINETGSFASGIYCGGSILRTDNVLQVGNNGSAFYALSDGRLYCSYHAQIGSSLSLWTDNEGGNINIKSGNGHTNSWEIDSYNGNLRFYTYRESDGAFQFNYFDQNNGYIGNAHWASKAGTLARSGDANYPMTFHWSGQDGQPSWIWGGNDGTNMYVYNPANFSVNYANSCYRSNYTYYVDDFSTSNPQNDSIASFRVSTINEYGSSSPSINPTGDWYFHWTKGSVYACDLAMAYHSDHYYFRRKVNGGLKPYQRIVTGPAQIYGSSLPGEASDGNVFFLITN